MSFLLVLPLALPGIVTGMALNATFNTGGIPFSFITIVVGHATFCVVVVYNNVIARLRRSSPSIEEASMDLGADTWQTFRYVTLPVVRTALLAGGLLAFALSFDEVIVTTFTAGTEQTLPIWILANLRLPNQRPLVNVVAVVLIMLSAVPVYLVAAAQQRRRRARPARLTGRELACLPAAGVPAGPGPGRVLVRQSIAWRPRRSARARTPPRSRAPPGPRGHAEPCHPPARTSRVSSHPRSLRGVPDRRSGDAMIAVATYLPLIRASRRDRPAGAPPA